MGESITEGTISAILKKAGEKVEEDEPIMQIETDKVTIDVRAPQAGVLQHLLVRSQTCFLTPQYLS
jgi:2-oxoglutarate dehydrogenase E2 component (dihydrolipoamide succinyltransferase)